MNKTSIKISIPQLFVSVNMSYGAVRFGRYKMPRLRLTDDARSYKNSIAWEAKRVYRGDPIAGPVKVSVWYYFKDKRRRDIQNDKLTFDGLADGGIYKDDNQIYELCLYKRFDKKCPRTEILIETIE